VDQKADVFIKMEHRRIEFARLKSLGLAWLIYHVSSLAAIEAFMLRFIIYTY
jgi:hypothetical protein